MVLWRVLFDGSLQGKKCVDLLRKRNKFSAAMEMCVVQTCVVKSKMLWRHLYNTHRRTYTDHPKVVRLKYDHNTPVHSKYYTYLTLSDGYYVFHCQGKSSNRSVYI